MYRNTFDMQPVKRMHEYNKLGLLIVTAVFFYSIATEHSRVFVPLSILQGHAGWCLASGHDAGRQASGRGILEELQQCRSAVLGSKVPGYPGVL